MPQYDVDVNLTVEIPEDEVKALEEEDEALENYLEQHLIAQFSFGDAWVTSVNRAEKLGK